jgi:hypothetical protein
MRQAEHLRAAHRAAQLAWLSLPAELRSSPRMREVLTRIPIELAQLHREHLIRELERSGEIAPARSL